MPRYVIYSIIIFSLALLSISLYSFFIIDKKVSEKIVNQAAIGGDFTLHDTDNNKFTEQDIKGKVSIMYFGYTYCPDICPTTLQVISNALQQLNPDELSQIKVLFISVDPQRDTNEILKSYMKHFNPAIIALTGTDSQLKDMAKKYKFFYQKRQGKEDDYVVDHSTYFYLFDEYGKYMTHLSMENSTEEIISKIKEAILTKKIDDAVGDKL
jgi:cytochrome oxidase Cu insertion factor (SCO1/SenC/PrrC family)